jgi:phospholipid/cholesterol/gamma-HCH transport system substrate-binding protein
MMNRSLLDLWVGIFVALGLAAVIFIALKVANQSSFHAAPSYEVVAYFNNIGGLKLRSPVKSAGVIVGRVTDIQLDTKTYQAKVAMALDQQYVFSTDSTASIITSGLLGEQYVGLEVGAETDMLKNGDTIQLTSSALLLEKLIGEFGLTKASTKSTGSSANE